MAYLVLTLIALGLLIGFLILTVFEERRGMRVWAPARERFDTHVERLAFIVEHVDFAAFVREEARRLAIRIGHDIAHQSLQVVRAVERFLTNIVRTFRMRHSAPEAPRENAREFVKVLSDFKEQLEANRPDIPDIHNT